MKNDVRIVEDIREVVRDEDGNEWIETDGPTCINVKRQFPFHKVGYEDPSQKGSRDPWTFVVLCKHGTIGPFGGSELLACTQNHWCPVKFAYRKSKATAAIEKCPVCRVTQDADDGVNGKFHVKDAKQVFQIMGAIRK